MLARVINELHTEPHRFTNHIEIANTIYLSWSIIRRNPVIVLCSTSEDSERCFDKDFPPFYAGKDHSQPMVKCYEFTMTIL